MSKVDLISGDGLNANGTVGQRILGDGIFTPSENRPFLDDDGKVKIMVYNYKKGPQTEIKAWEKMPINVNAATVLRKDEWKQLDEAVQGAARERLAGVSDLESRGLVFNLGNAMATTVLEYDEQDDFGSASVSMDGLTRGKNDRPEFERKLLPIPITHADYQINLRALEASRRLGNGIDTIDAEMAARNVAVIQEDMLFKNTTYGFAGGTIYSYINHPSRNTKAIVKNWDDSTKTGEDIVNQVLAMKQDAIDDGHYGPYMLYIPTDYETAIDKDYDTSTPGTTIRERLLKIENILGIKTIDRLPANNVLLVQMTSNVVRLVKGFGLTNVQWDSEGGFAKNFKVMTIQLPQIRAAAGGKSGIVHLA
jgi:uncharacterized linocin/CFP29 family protein